MKIRTVFVKVNNAFSYTTDLFNGGDEVNDLNILRLMSKKSYIVSCFEAVVEAKMAAASISDHKSDCRCHTFVDGTLSSKDIEENDDNENHLMTDRKMNEDLEFHYCPAHENFKPNMHCTEHVECNDPIYR